MVCVLATLETTSHSKGPCGMHKIRTVDSSTVGKIMSILAFMAKFAITL